MYINNTNMFKIGDRVVLIKYPKGASYLITDVINDKIIDMKPINSKNKISFANVDSSILEYDFVYYRNKKINKILTKIK